MPDLVDELQLKFGVAPPAPTFRLEIDARDGWLDGPILVEPLTVHSYLWTDDEYKSFYEGRELPKVLENGYRIARLYAPPDIPVDLFSTEPPVRIKSTSAIVWRNNIVPAGASAQFTIKQNVGRETTVYVGARQAMQSPEKPELMGVREELVTDVLRFHRSRIAFLKCSYVTRGIEVLYRSQFVTLDGRTIDPPAWRPDLGGAWILPEDATGSLVLRYLVPYRQCRFHYGLTQGYGWDDIQLAWLRGDITQFPMPHVQAFAVAHAEGLVADLEFDKRVFPPGAHLLSWDQKTRKQVENPNTNGTVLSENDSTEVLRTITDPSGSGASVQVADKTVVKMTDSAGRPWTMKLKNQPT